MEYILGSLVTLVCVIVLNKIIRSSLNQKQNNFSVTQSYLFKILSEYNDRALEDKLPDTQSYKHVKSQYVKIMIVDDEAYWIRNNQLYVAPFQNGEIDESSTREVDTIDMPAVELKKTMFIVEKLSEDK